MDFEEKGTSEAELGGRVEFLRVQPGKDHCQYKGWQHLLCASRRVKGLRTLHAAGAMLKSAGGEPFPYEFC